MTRAPDVSVVIPCKDSGALLRRSVESALAGVEGSGPEIEVVVVDDGSTDETTLAVQAELREHGRVRVERNHNPPGPAGARNTGIERARGTWIAFLDSDDFWLPGSVSARWRIVDSEPEARFIASDFEERDEGGGIQEWLSTQLSDDPLSREMAAAREAGSWVRVEDPVREILGRSRLVWTGTVMARRDLLLDLGGFHEGLRGPEDTHLWLRIAAVTDLFFLPVPTAVYHRREGSLTLQADRPPKLESTYAFRLLLREDSLRPYRTLLRQRLAGLNASVATWHRRQGSPLTAVRWAAAAIAREPGNARYWRVLAGALLLRR